MPHSMSEMVGRTGSRVRTGATAFLWAITFCVISVGLITMPIWMDNLTDRWREAGPRAYRDITLIPRICPVLAPMAREILRDGYISLHEARGLGERLDDLSRERSLSIELNSAKRPLGIDGAAVPDDCTNSPEGYKEIGTVMSPLWIK